MTREATLHLYGWCPTCGVHFTNMYRADQWRDHQIDLEATKLDLLECGNCSEGLLACPYCADTITMFAADNGDHVFHGKCPHCERLVTTPIPFHNKPYNALVSTMVRQILDKIRVELAHQDRKWGADRILDRNLWVTILTEEIGEVARGSLDNDVDNYLDELVDVAATAIHAYQSVLLERQRASAAQVSHD